MWLGAVGSNPLGAEWLITDVFFFKVDGPITRGGGGGGLINIIFTVYWPKKVSRLTLEEDAWVSLASSVDISSGLVIPC